MLESRESYKFAGGPITFSCWYRTGSGYSGTGFTPTIIYGTGIDQNGVASGFTNQVTLAGPTYPNSNAWQRATFTTFIGQTASQVGLYALYTPTGTAGGFDYFDVTGVQLEKGSVATPFEVRPYATELALCQRYFETGSRGYYPLAGAYGASYGGTVFYKVTKRASGGTITLYDDVPTAGKVGGIVSGSATNGITGTAENTGVSGFTFTMTAGYSLAYFTWTSQSEL